MHILVGYSMMKPLFELKRKSFDAEKSFIGQISGLTFYSI